MADNTDLVGGPFAVIESDPGVFTSLTRQLGVKNIELIELYDIEPWAVDHLRPHGLIFCFSWKKDKEEQRPKDTDLENDPVEQVWFANQLSDDACASHAILNVLLNCDQENVDIGEDLSFFRNETKDMSGVMKGLAVSSSHYIRTAHNSLARPADIRGAQNSLVRSSLSAQKKKAAKAARSAEQAKPKRGVRTNGKVPPKQNKKKKDEDEEQEEEEEAYHFIGYVPAYGKVWELDGFKPGPLEVGELPSTSASSTTSEGWMDVVRPALRLKMAKYGDAEGGGGRFSLLAVVDGLYEKASDEWEFWKKERRAVERRLDQVDIGWKEKVDPTILCSAEEACNLSNSSANIIPGPINTTSFSTSFAGRRMDSDMGILRETDSGTLVQRYEGAVKECLSARMSVEEELTKGNTVQIDHVKRTHDYEPFLCEFVKCLHAQGVIDSLVAPTTKTSAKKSGTRVTNGKGNSRKKAKLDEDYDEED